MMMTHLWHNITVNDDDTPDILQLWMMMMTHLWHNTTVNDDDDTPMTYYNCERWWWYIYDINITVNDGDNTPIHTTTVNDDDDIIQLWMMMTHKNCSAFS